MAISASITSHPDVDQWIEFSPEGRVTVHTGKVDIGQRISTALAIIVAEELDVNYDLIDIKRTETGIDPDEGFTSGSMSMQHSGSALRLASATARHFLLERAAIKLDVNIDSLEVDNALIQSRDSNATVTFWELMNGNKFGIKINEEIEVKNFENHNLVGSSVIAKNMADILTGKIRYLHDLELPGMLHARLVRPPHYHATLKGLDEKLTKKLEKSNIKIVKNGSFLAVVSSREYSAIKAARRIATSVEWDLGDGISSKDLYEALSSNERISLPIAAGGAPEDAPVNPISEPPTEAVITVSARFEKPYVMHGSIGPSAGCAIYDGKKLTIWSHNQGVYPLRNAVAEALNMSTEDIHVIFEYGSGCYGHNGADDAAFDAALIAIEIPNTPILLKWTRDDEHAWEPYGTAMSCELRGSLDNEGNIIDWSHESFGDTHMGRPASGRAGSPAEKLVSTHLKENPLDWPVMPPTMGAHVGIHRNLEPLYQFPKTRLVKHLVRDLPLRVSALRTLGAFANVSALESFIDELAEAGGLSSIELRLKYLADERAKTVIKELDKQMKRNNAGMAESVGSGIAFAQYKNSAAYCAVGIELEVDETANVLLHRAWIVADAGEVVDPNGLIAQLEGGLIQAASWSLLERVSYDGGGITSRDWESYPILRFDNIPTIETTLIEQKGKPFLGAGEASSGPTGGAIINAIYEAIGLRLRKMPFDADAIRLAAMN